MRKKLWLVIGLGLMVILLGMAGCGITTPPSGVPVTAGIITQQSTGIWVNGEGKTSAVPDVAILSVGVQAQESTVAQAQNEAATAMDAVIKQLTAGGVASKDIQTRQFSIVPVRTTNTETGQQTLIGYSVTNTVTAKIRKVDNTGTIIDAVVKAGGDFTIINSIGFTVDDPTPYLKDIRAQAMADALSRAQQLADAAGAKLGPPTYINESGGYVPTVAMAAPGFAPVTPISPGQTQITLNVQVVYSIR